MNIKILSHTENPINQMASIARVSHKSHRTEERTDEDLLRDIIKWKHFSVLEHAYATIEIEGISRACSHQIVRHRHFSILQESQRYVKSDERGYYMPYSIVSDDKSKIPYINLLKTIEKTYNQLLEYGVPKEDARMLLPNATLTKLVLTGNFRTWREFIIKRDTKAAQQEIRELAKHIKTLLAQISTYFIWDRGKYEQ